MRWRRIGFWVPFSTLALLVLALAWLWVADLGVFKPQVERFITAQTGRDFSINGNFHVDLARHSSIVAEDVRFQNAEWADAADMVKIGRVEVRVDTWSLISGPIIVELIDLDDADIQLIQPDDGEPNWVLPIGADPGVSEVESPGLNILFEQIDIDRVGVVFESVDRNRPLHLDIEHLDQRHREDGFLDMELRATLDGRQITIGGEVGTWEALLAGKGFEFDIDAVLDTFEFSARGRIDDIVDLRRPEMEFTAAGPDIDDLTRLLGVGTDGEGDIDLEGALTPQADGPLVLMINGNIGKTEINVTGSVADLKNLDDIGLKVVASGPDLGRILRIAGIHEVREAPFMVRIDAETIDGALVINEASMVFAEAQIDGTAYLPNFPSIDNALLKLDIEGPDIARFRYLTGIPGAAQGAFKLGFDIDATDEGVEVLHLEVATSLAEIVADGRLGAPPEFFGSQFSFKLNSQSLARMAAAYGISDLPDYPIEIAGAVEYAQGSIRTQGPVTARVERLRAAVEGQIALTPGAQGSDIAFEIAGPDLAALIGTFVTADDVPVQAYDVSGRLQIRGDGIRFREVRGNIGSSVIEIDGLVTQKRGLSGTRFDFDFAGPAFEEVIDTIGEFEVRPGPYEFSGSVLLESDLLTLSDINLDRPAGNVRLDFKLGLPVEREWMDFALRASGRDVRSLLHKFEGYDVYEQSFSLDVRGDRRGDHWTFDKLEVGIGEATLAAAGDLELQDAQANTEFKFNLNIPSLARLGEIGGRKFNDQRMSLYAHVIGGDGVLELDQFDAKIGVSDIGGRMLLRKGAVPELEINIFSDSIIYMPLLEDVEYEPAPTFEDGRVIPDIAVPFAVMKQLNASIEIDIRELRQDPLLMRNIEFDADLRDGALVISKAAFKARSGAMLARARLEPVEDSGAASIELVARQFALGMSQTNLDLAMTGDIDINLESTGADLRTLLGNASGELFVNARGGRVTNNRFLQALYGDLLQEILGTINPFAQSDPYTDFECVVVSLRIDDGQVASAPSSFVSTARVLMESTSSINLKTEEMRMSVTTTPRRALSISAGELINPYVLIGGTLAAPRLAVDETGLLISGGAAVATGGLSLVAKGLWERLSRAKDPCQQASDRAIEALSDRFPNLSIGEPEETE